MIYQWLEDDTGPVTEAPLAGGWVHDANVEVGVGHEARLIVVLGQELLLVESHLPVELDGLLVAHHHVQVEGVGALGLQLVHGRPHQVRGDSLTAGFRDHHHSRDIRHLLVAVEKPGLFSAQIPHRVGFLRVLHHSHCPDEFFSQESAEGVVYAVVRSEHHPIVVGVYLR